MNKKIFFLNPPGTNLYIRDYYCSKVSKAYYMPQPVDLLIQTGFFKKEKGYSLKVLDAIIENSTVESTLKIIQSFDPDIIVSQFGSVSMDEDSSFLEKAKNLLPDTLIVSSGDLFLEDPKLFLEKYKWLNGIITNFFGDGLLAFVEENYEEVSGMVFKLNGNIIDKRDTSNQKDVKIPLPRHELFKNHLYRMPFATKYPMATVLTNYACPYPCTFCIMSTLGFQRRSADDIIQEIQALADLGIKYIYFSDQTFFVNKEITEKVLKYMIKEDLNIDWMCFSRVDILDKEMMILMKAAGCNVIMFGVEWAEDELCKKYKKQYTIKQVKETFKVAKEIGIKRMGTFLLGVPGQSEESIKNTVDFAIEIDADYASFNIAVPRAKTSFREEAIMQGLIDEDLRVMDQSGSFIAMGTGLVNAERIAELKKDAYRRFYFRPKYIYKRIIGIRSISEFRTHLIEGFYILKGILS